MILIHINDKNTLFKNKHIIFIYINNLKKFKKNDNISLYIIDFNMNAIQINNISN